MTLLKPLRVGVACERLPEHGADSATQTVRRAGELGLDVLAFPSSRAVSADLDPAELDAVREQAAEFSLSLEVGVGRIAWTEGHEDLTELDRRFDAAVRLGSTEITGYTTLDRFSADRSFTDQLDDVVAVMSHLARRAAEADVHANLESHEDLSSFDVLEVLARVDSSAVGVNLDLPNLVVRGEDPLEATRRLAPHVRQTQVEDVTFSLTPDGVHRHLTACGQGIINWTDIVQTLIDESPCRSLCIEQHRGQFGARLFDRDWLTAHPDLPAFEPLSLVGHAVRSGAQVLTSDSDLPARSEAQIGIDLIASVAALRDVLTQISRERSAGSSVGLMQ